MNNIPSVNPHQCLDSEHFLYCDLFVTGIKICNKKNDKVKVSSIFFLLKTQNNRLAHHRCEQLDMA